MKKFWTTLAGKVGTAHQNRQGKMVDFRAAERPPEIKDVEGRKVMMIYPPKGVAVDPLVLELTHEEWVVTKLDDPPGCEHGHSIYRSNFCGVEFEITAEGWRWYDEAKHEAFRAADRAERDAIKAREREEQRLQYDFAAALEPTWFVGKLSLRELGQVRDGSLDLAARLKQEIYRAIEEEFGQRVRISLEFLFSPWLDGGEGTKKLEEIRQLLLEEENRLREERKQVWLAKVGQGGKDDRD